MPNLSTKVSPEFARRARNAAKRRGKTVSAFVKEAVAERIQEEAPKSLGELFPEIVRGPGIFKGPKNLSEREGYDD